VSVRINKTSTLKRFPRGDAVINIMEAALLAVEPAAAVRRFVQRQGNFLTVADQVLDLSRVHRVRLVGAGKAGYPMAVALSAILGEKLHDGVVVVKEGYLGEAQLAPLIQFIQAGHPIPDQRGVQASIQVEAFLADSQADDLVIALISGGGSALLTAPAAGVTLEEIQQLTTALLACGANISEINTLRKHLERLKGGGLARLCAPAALIALVLSDVVGDPLDVIASGPTVPDPTTFRDALYILDCYHLFENIPATILERLRRGASGELVETPKPGEAIFDRVKNVIIGNNFLAAQAAMQAAAAEDMGAYLLTTDLQGEACQVGEELAGSLRLATTTGYALPRPVCLVAGGETTVTIGDLSTAGKGGRNLELALAAVEHLAGLPDVLLATLATDGGDGSTDAAGAVVSGETLSRARLKGLQPGDYLRRHDSYTFFATLGDLLKPGPTQTNVNDLVFLFAI
jgi:hydroxypyruvate reductase